MRALYFPITFLFKYSTLSNDFTATDASGKTIAYVKQKMFKLKEQIAIYEDDTKSKVNYTIKADTWLDFSAVYGFFDRNGTEIGKIARKGWASLWKAEYELIDQNQQLQYHIREESAIVKVMDTLFGQIPYLKAFSGYVFNPTYIVTDKNDQIVVRLKKIPSLLGREFQIDKLKSFDSDDDERIMLGLMMMILLERRRG